MKAPIDIAITPDEIQTSETFRFALQNLSPWIHRILEVGCGNGALSRRLKDLGLEVIAIDSSTEAIAKALRPAVTAILFGESYENPKSFRPLNLSPETVARIIGDHRFDCGLEIKIFQKNGQLFSRGIYPEYDVPLIPMSENELLNRFFWDSLIFVNDETGKPNQLHWNADPNTRAKRVGG